MMNSAVKVTGLCVTRGGHRALRGVDLEVPRGQVAGLLGPSGCGKTTLIRAIVGVQVVESGTVEVLGLPAGLRELRSRVGYATQAPAVYADLTVQENLEYFGQVLGAPRTDVARVIEQVDLGAQAGRITGSLSGGQLNRVNLGVALLGSPELVVLDEPTVGLDPVLRQELWELFHRLVQDGTTLLISSHVMDEAARCEQLIMLRDGRVLAEGTPAALRARTGTDDLEQAFLRLITERSGE